MRGEGKNPSRSDGKYLHNNQQSFQQSGKINDEISDGDSINKQIDLSKNIVEFRRQRKIKQERLKNLTVIKRSNKVFQALNLPTVLNLNPRSVYNKVKEFITFFEEKDIDLVCMSESWEREDLPLDKIIEIDKFEIISNVFQRTGQGGRPAIFEPTKENIM